MIRCLKWLLLALVVGAMLAAVCDALVDAVGVAAVLVLAAYIPAVGFPVCYAFYPFWKTPAGRSVMGLALVIAFALSLSVWRIFWGQPPEAVRIAIYALIIPALWAQLIVLLLAPRLNRRRLARLPVPPISEVSHDAH